MHHGDGQKFQICAILFRRWKKQKDENNQQKMCDQAVELAVFYYRGNKFKNEIKRETTAP